MERQTCEGEVANYSKDRQGGDNRESCGASLCVKLGNRMRKTTMREDSRLFVAVVMRVAEDCSECRPCHCPALLEVYRHRGTVFTMTSQSYQVPHVRRASLYVQLAHCNL